MSDNMDTQYRVVIVTNYSNKLIKVLNLQAKYASITLIQYLCTRGAGKAG